MKKYEENRLILSVIHPRASILADDVPICKLGPDWRCYDVAKKGVTNSATVTWSPNQVMLLGLLRQWGSHVVVVDIFIG